MLLTKIDHHLDVAHQKMGDGINDLRVAGQHKQRESKCLCSWCLIVFAIAAILAGVIYFLVVYKGDGGQ
jgi:hypothetical protein